MKIIRAAPHRAARCVRGSRRPPRYTGLGNNRFCPSAVFTFERRSYVDGSTAGTPECRWPVSRCRRPHGGSNEKAGSLGVGPGVRGRRFGSLSGSRGAAARRRDRGRHRRGGSDRWYRCGKRRIATAAVRLLSPLLWLLRAVVRLCVAVLWFCLCARAFVPALLCARVFVQALLCACVRVPFVPVISSGRFQPGWLRRRAALARWSPLALRPRHE